MDIQKHWNHALQEIQLSIDSRILLAVSGGVDSMVLLDLFRQSGFQSVQLAHVNFGLRGDSSNADQAMIERLAQEFGIPVHIHKPDTEDYAAENGISIQMAAREIRYSWFDEVMKSERIDILATAHHRDDQVETVLQNMVRGTKRKGLEGMKLREDKVIRPLLNCTKAMIREYAKVNRVEYREDASNDSLKYHRNRIRHRVIPELEAINTAASDHIADMANFIQRYNRVMDGVFEEVYQSYTTLKTGRTIIPKPTNDREKLALELFLYERGYSRVDQILRSCDEGESGRYFDRDTERLLIDRGQLILEPKNREVQSVFQFQSDNETSLEPLMLKWELISRDQFDAMSDFTNVLAFDADRLEFPITLRRWTDGDRFSPLGLGGSKKVKDFLTDRKVDRFIKERTCVLVSDNEIVGVVGHQIDDRYKVVDTTKMVYLARSNAQ
jgi:tRNA(Ile)-lysidine synthase